MAIFILTDGIKPSMGGGGVISARLAE